MSSEKISKVWPEWHVERQLGKGSYGVVYEAVRTDNGITSKAAIKVISIPQDYAEIDSLRSEGLTVDATKVYFKGIVDDFANEIKLMESFKGIQNIVSVEDYKVVERQDEIGWDIYIRMELLTPFNTYIRDRKITEEEVAKLGCDICTALEICAKRNIIHRDIKPENIFVNDFGFYKLGDFGIARKMENMTSGLSQKGTYNYMAPEVYNGSPYDARVDLYSLGIVLYRLLNKNRLPFLNTDKQLMDPNERKAVLERRLKGEELPPPCEASPKMASIILSACAHDPSKRFGSAKAMKNALTLVLNELSTNHSSIHQATPEPDLDATISIHHTSVSADDATVSVHSETNPDATVSIHNADINPDATVAVQHASVDLNATMAVHSAGGNSSASANNGNENGSKKETKNTFGKKKSKLPLILLILLLLIAGGVGVYVLLSSENTKQEDEIADILTKANTEAMQRDYYDAIDIIEEGLDKYPDSDKLEEKLEYYKEKLEEQTEEAQKPTPTESVKATDAPKATEPPKAVTEAPKATDVPKTTEEPEITEAPEATEAPAMTEAPKATNTPKPKATGTPKPKATATPKPAAHTHSYDENYVCSCGSVSYTKGLSYEYYNPGDYYIVTGIGSATGTEIIIPSEYEGITVAEIEKEAFKGLSKITKVVIPSTIIHIGDNAFSNMKKLNTIEYNAINSTCYFNGTFKSAGQSGKGIALTIGSKVKQIPDGLFFGDASAYVNLSSVTFKGKKVKTIGVQAFQNCKNLKEIKLPEGVTKIDSFAFDNCSGAKSLVIPSTVTTIAEGAFNNMYGLTDLQYNVANVSIPASGWIQDAGKNSTGIKLTIGEKVKNIPARLFAGTDSSFINLSTLKFAGTAVETIGESAFYNCRNLGSVNIGEGVTAISKSAFENCSGATLLSIPTTVTFIDKNAFNNMTGLEFIQYNAINCSLDKAGAFASVGQASKGIALKIGEEVKVIPDNIFNGSEYGFANIISLSFKGKKTTKIGSHAFYYCKNMRDVSFNEGLEVIGEYAFYYNKEIKEFTLPKTLKEIQPYAFSNCASLRNVNMKDTNNWRITGMYQTSITFGDSYEIATDLTKNYTDHKFYKEK
ncbi:MAG: leucine-rich repeat protein [Lachnospiraceae bacterium]|nr:leucine-rich repeat protein [Lachnospiraceae bacterium]